VRRALVLGLLGALLLAGSLTFQLIRGGQERDAAPQPEPRAAAAPSRPGARDAPPAAAAVAPDATVPSFDIVRVNPDGDAVIAGRAAPGATVTVLEDGRPIGRATADARGEWVVVPTEPLAGGRRALSLEVERAGAPPLRSERVVTLDVPSPATALRETRADSAANAASMPLADADRAVVEPGNSLWRLAIRRYGHGTEYGVIYRANRAQIRDPDLIYPGQVFVIPPER
jgi:nucleoid-associated protein YgaU